MSSSKKVEHQAAASGPTPLGRNTILRAFWPLSLRPKPVETALVGENLYLRHPTFGDYRQWALVRGQSAGFLKPWEPLWPRDDLTPEGFHRRMERFRQDMRQGRSLPYLIFSLQDNQLLGGINVSNIRRGICQMASIGYWMGSAHAGQGHMNAALALLLPYLFDHQGLHRLEAACMPHNHASIAVLRRQGFHLEGKARRYLQINGKWEDHLLFGLLRSDIDDRCG